MFGIKNLTRYNEGLIVACMLRLITPPEWGEKNQSKLAEKLLHMAGNPNMEICLGELLVSEARGGIKQIRGQTLTDRLRQSIPAHYVSILDFFKL